MIILATVIINSCTNKPNVQMDNDTFKMLKLSQNRKAGRPTITVSSLRRQPAELQADRAGIIFLTKQHQLIKHNNNHRCHEIGLKKKP